MFRRRAVPAVMATLVSLRQKVDIFSGDATNFADLVKADGVIVDFFTDWCGPCKAVAPKFEALSNKEEYHGVKFLKVNVEENEEVGAMHKIRSIPTFVAYKDGKVVGHVEGADIATVEALVKNIK